MSTIYVNGRFLTQRLSGVQRYAREATCALDRLIADNPETLGKTNWILVCPPGADRLPLRAIQNMVVGGRHGHRWEQIDLARHARGKPLVNLANSAPLLHRKSITVVHDAAVFRTRANFSRRYGSFHRLMTRAVAALSQLGTVSEFSRRELAAVTQRSATSIFVAPNGCDHLRRVEPDFGSLKDLGLEDTAYFLFVGSPTHNKNLMVAVQAFKLLNRPNVRFVIAGSADKTIFAGQNMHDIAGVVLARDLNDSAIAALYQNATALVFPSLYEGFGIPPLEAMASNCPVLASNIEVLHETCGEAALYIDARNPAAWADAMGRCLDQPELRKEMIRRGQSRAALFTWDKAAIALVSVLGLAGSNLS